MTSKINIFGGRYGLGSKEFKPRDVKAIAEGMMRGTLRHNFTVGITDDVTGLSLPTDAAFGIEDITPALAAGAARNFAGRGVGLISQNNQIDSDDLTNEPIPRPSQESARATPAARAGVEQRKSAILYGIGSDGTVSAVKNIVKIVGENSKLYPQSYAVYDSKKSGGLTASHLRFAPKPIRSQYLVEYADFIGVSSFMIAQRFDVFKGLKPGGTVMINTSRSPNDAFSNLPRAVQEHLIRMRARVFFLDANRGAEELGLGRRINTFIMLNFFNLTHVIDPKIVAARAKEAIEKTYKKKGEAVIAANWAAVDRAADFLHEYTLPSSPSGFAPDWTPAMTPDAPARIAGVLGEMAAMRGDDLPVSVFVPSRLTPVGGEWPRSGRGGASSNKNSLSEVAPPSPPSLSLRRDSPPQEGGHATEPSFAYGEYPVGTSKYEKRAISERVASVDLNICIQC
ncbi:MAG: 2-oxoacid:acceptor oxidoreductase family protein, partial [Proteobacteria bacterium]|nr:2-oxoacid:acceptor oxidoreductase family protein [Pseudomonadota bacterium]